MRIAIAMLIASMLSTVGRRPGGCTANARHRFPPTNRWWVPHVHRRRDRKEKGSGQSRGPRETRIADIKGARVEVHEEWTGSKVVKCLFAYCADIADKANTSVQLVDRQGRQECLVLRGEQGPRRKKSAIYGGGGRIPPQEWLFSPPKRCGILSRVAGC